MRIALALLATGLALVASVEAQSAKPQYLPYADFSQQEPANHVVVKKAYNEAVQRYNQGLYDYYATLEKHDRLVDLGNTSADAVERQKARDEAAPLRAKLTSLRGEITRLAAAVDQAARRASAEGVSVRP